MAGDTNRDRTAGRTQPVRERDQGDLPPAPVGDLLREDARVGGVVLRLQIGEHPLPAHSGSLPCHRQPG